MVNAEWQSGFSFEILAKDPHSRARLGRLTTPHGIIATPAFMPVGTYGAVKGISPDELLQAGAEIILSNALHLEFRPGSEIVSALGGLHRLMGWDKPILTDSGGFQTFSLAKLTRRNEVGIEVRSPVNGSKFQITPERIIHIQRNLGTDFMMPLDVCAPGDASRESVVEALETTLRWAALSREAYDRSNPIHLKPQALFGIVQGGIYGDLRQQAVERLLEIGFFGYALGGLAVGEPIDATWETVEFCTGLLPEDKPRYMMGTGTPEDLRTAINLGVDLFDCVLPTRNGRKGSLFLHDGKINLRNAAFRHDINPIAADCHCYACRQDENGRPKFSKGAIRHLLVSGDPLGARLGALHNLTFYQDVVRTARETLKLNSETV
ncbi:MAG: tRNA guanosine(34) transglycosylase Tgt [bacterium]|nr:tRNA guanosine(34) transglycosylase Tgt [bacterium]